MIAIGAASSNGQGVATTSTATARVASPLTSQAPPASSRVNGTKMIAMRSAARTNGDELACACSTRRTICA